MVLLVVAAEELVSLRESEEKLKQQQQEATQRENMLVMRLSSKDQEMQDYIVRSVPSVKCLSLRVVYKVVCGWIDIIWSNYG